MKKGLVLLLVVLCYFLAGPGFSQADSNLSLHAEWGYTPPSAPAVTGFSLYCNGRFITSFPGSSTTASNFTMIALTSDGNSLSFTMTANFDDSTESPHSAPYLYSILVHPQSPAGFMRISNYQQIPLELENGWSPVVPYGADQRVIRVSIKVG